MGRPSKMSEERVRLIERALRLGLSYATAAALADVDEGTVHRWRRRYVGFRQRLEKAKGEGRLRVVGKLHELIDSGNTAATIFWLKTRTQEFRQVPPGYVKIAEPADVDGADAFL